MKKKIIKKEYNYFVLGYVRCKMRKKKVTAVLVGMMLMAAVFGCRKSGNEQTGAQENKTEITTESTSEMTTESQSTEEASSEDQQENTTGQICETTLMSHRRYHRTIILSRLRRSTATEWRIPTRTASMMMMHCLLT